MLNIGLKVLKAGQEQPAKPAVEPAIRRPVRPYKLDCRYIKRDPGSLEPLEPHSPDQSARRERAALMFPSTPAPQMLYNNEAGVYREVPSFACTPEKPLPSPLSLHLSRLMQAIEPLSDVKLGCVGEAEECSEPSTAQTPVLSILSGRPGRGGCSCKKSRCLKLYCECFASQNGCSEHCECTGCFNRPEFEKVTDIVRRELLGANPGAFEPKIERGSHAKGCTCRRNLCQKKYCECFDAGVRCSALCRCVGCRNDKEPGDSARMYRPITKSRKVPLGLLIEKLKVLSRIEQLN